MIHKKDKYSEIKGITKKDLRGNLDKTYKKKPPSLDLKKDSPSDKIHEELRQLILVKEKFSKEQEEQMFDFFKNLNTNFKH